MNFVFISLLTLSMSGFALAGNYELAGRWKLVGQENQKPVTFVSVDREAYSLTTERFVQPSGILEYKIDQNISFSETGSDSLTGKVSFFDSRGCSFPDLEVKAQFTSFYELNMLITIPRYKVITTASGPMNGYYAPTYCEYQGGTHYGAQPYSYRYVCGRRFVKPRKRVECKLIEYVQVPVQLKRLQ